jgi:hypothetical protein
MDSENASPEVRSTVIASWALLSFSFLRVDLATTAELHPVDTRSRGAVGPLSFHSHPTASGAALAFPERPLEASLRDETTELPQQASFFFFHHES